MSYGSAYKGTGSNDEINRLTAQIGWVYDHMHGQSYALI
jgi:hypothetical protein